MKKIIKGFGLVMISLVIGIIAGVIMITGFCEKIMTNEVERANKNGYIFRKVCKWLRAEQRRQTIDLKLRERQISEVAIYGNGEMGKCLIRELENSDVKIKYLIDKNSNSNELTYKCYHPKDLLPEVQAIIITPIYQYAEIVAELKYSGNVQIISLEELIDELGD